MVCETVEKSSDIGFDVFTQYDIIFSECRRIGAVKKEDFIFHSSFLHALGSGTTEHASGLIPFKNLYNGTA